MKEKKTKNEQRLGDLSGNIKYTNICITETPEKEEREIKNIWRNNSQKRSKFNEKHSDQRSSMNLRWVKHKEIHIQTHYSQNVESRRQRENLIAGREKQFIK